MLSTAELEQLAEMIADRMQKTTPASSLVDRHALAARLSMSVATVDRLLKNNKIPCVRVSSRVLFSPEKVIAALESSTLQES